MSRLFNQCPRCGTDLPSKDATSCSCGWKKRESAKAEKASAGPVLCGWNDYGDLCSERGIIGPNHLPLYCREHAYRKYGWTGMEGRRGNELPEPITNSFAVEDIRKQLKARDAGPGPLAKFLPAHEPGEDREEEAA